MMCGGAGTPTFELREKAPLPSLENSLAGGHFETDAQTVKLLSEYKHSPRQG
jgi:hypothetical protein